MLDADVLDGADAVSEAEWALQNETSPAALEAVVKRLEAVDARHELLLLLEAKIVAVLIGIAPKRGN